MPVSAATDADRLAALLPLMAWATVGVVVGTIAGQRLLVRFPEVWFRRLVAIVLAALGAIMLARAVA